MSPPSISDIVKVVWTGKNKPDRSRLRSRFTVRKDKVYNVLKWLVDNYEDYRNNVTIDEERISGWESTFVAVKLLDTIGHVSDPSAEDASRDGFGMDNPDDEAISSTFCFRVSFFDISRLNHNSLKANVLTRRKTWPATALLLESLTVE